MKTKRRILPVGLALLLAVCFLLTACNTGDKPDAPSDNTSAAESVADPSADSSTDEPADSDASVPDADSSADATSGSQSGGSTTKKPGSSSTTGKSNSTKATQTKPFNPPDTSRPSTGYADDPIVDMGGYTFTFGSPWMPARLSRNATLFEQLFWERKEQVEKDYNCTIKIINIYATPEQIQPLIMAKKKVADVVEMSAEMWIPDAKAGYIVPWNDIKGVNIDDDRWIDAYTNYATMNGKVWGIQFTRPPEVRGCIFFNKTMLKANGVDPDSLYKLVDQKKWTFDKLKEYAVACTKDTNKDGKIDTYGITGDPGSVAAYLTMANGGRVVSFDKNNKAVASFNSKNCINALNFYNDLVNTSKVYYTEEAMFSQKTWNDVRTDWCKEVFMAGKAAFFITESYYGNQQIKPNVKNFDYGLLPMPIGPDGSGYTSSASNARVLCCTSTNAKSKDLSKTVTILNALARPLKGNEGEKWWLDDIQADYFQSNDKRSVDMYTLCLNSMTVDPAIGVQQLNFDYLQVGAFDSIFWKNSTPASALQGMQGKYTAAIDAVFNK